MNRVPGLAALALVISCGGARPTPPVTEPAPTSAAVTQPAPEPTPALPATSAIPDTPAGRTLTAWLDGFNSGDEARMRAFAEKHKAPGIVADMQFRTETGGFELLGIETSEPLELTFVVKEKAGPTKAVGRIKVKDADPAEIAAFELQAIPSGVTVAEMDRPLDATARARVIDNIAAKLDELYVFPETAKKMGEALREHQKAGAYDGVGRSRAFAKLLTEHLRAVSKDKHLWVQFSPKVLPQDDPEPSEEEKQQMRAQMEKVNCGFVKAERLDGDIGYLKFDFFGAADICGPKATAAFAAIGDVDALIIDLRENGGGEPEMVAFVSSYLFAKRTHLNDIYSRKDNKTEQFWTKPGVPGKKLAKQPVYVLTSLQTFSGAEEFSYNLKNLKRATIVGETTGGGAHPTMGARLDDHFMIGVPFARAINPITKTNWEGTGVKPDIEVPADQALETARKLAAKRR